VRQWRAVLSREEETEVESRWEEGGWREHQILDQRTLNTEISIKDRL
jgi:hypothetical protein